MELDSTDLFERLGRGDPLALEEICRRYGERVHCMARRVLGRTLRARLESADIAQEAMLEVVKSAGRCRFFSEASFLRWLAVVVERSVLKAARHWQASRRDIARDAALAPPLECLGGGTTPSRAFLRSERAKALANAIGSLSGKDRELVILRLLLQLPWEAVARTLGISQPTAQMRLLRAREKLARRLTTLGFGDAGK